MKFCFGVCKTPISQSETAKFRPGGKTSIMKFRFVIRRTTILLRKTTKFRLADGFGR